MGLEPTALYWEAKGRQIARVKGIIASGIDMKFRPALSRVVSGMPS